MYALGERFDCTTFSFYYHMLLAIHEVKYDIAPFSLNKSLQDGLVLVLILRFNYLYIRLNFDLYKLLSISNHQLRLRFSGIFEIVATNHVMNNLLVYLSARPLTPSILLTIPLV